MVSQCMLTRPHSKLHASSRLPIPLIRIADKATYRPSVLILVYVCVQFRVFSLVSCIHP